MKVKMEVVLNIEIDVDQIDLDWYSLPSLVPDNTLKVLSVRETLLEAK